MKQAMIETRTRSTPQGKLMSHVLHLVVCWIAASTLLSHFANRRETERERERGHGRRGGDQRASDHGGRNLPAAGSAQI